MLTRTWSCLMVWNHMLHHRCHAHRILALMDSNSAVIAMCLSICVTPVTPVQLQPQIYVKLRQSDASDASAFDPSDADSSYSGSSGSDDVSECGKGRVEITTQRLQSMHAVSSNNGTGSLSKYARNGRSKARVKQALDNPKCECACSVPLRTLLRICLTFWLLSKRGQDTVLWTIQQEHPGSKRDWYIEGLIMAGKNHPRLLYISNFTQWLENKRKKFKIISQWSHFSLSRTPRVQSCMDAPAWRWKETVVTM